jgi:chromosome segregation ATPase
VYPRTPRSYDALIGEFGDDLVSVEITRPTTSRDSNAETSVPAENQRLRDELAKIHDTLQSLSQGSQTAAGSELQTLRVLLQSRESELTSTHARLQEAEKELSLLKERLERAQQETISLRNTNVAKDFTRQLKELAKRAAEGDREFCAFVDKLTVDPSAPLELAKYLEETLRTLLTTKDRSLSLHDLISQARDAEVLTDEAFHLAHMIRRHRNIIAHEDVDKRTHAARVMLVLFAASLLWLLLPE